MKDWPEWNKSEVELPPEDGNYEVTQHPNFGPQAICTYDGYGFMHEGVYKYPPLWRGYRPKEKRYGIISK